MTVTSIAPDSTDALRRAVEAAIPAAQERAAILKQVRMALESGREDEALPLMRAYCGIEPIRAAA